MPQPPRHFIEQCLNGHPAAYRQLIAQFQTPLLAYLTGRLGRQHDAEEAAQETFVRAYFNLPKLEKPESFFSWLLGIASRVAAEQLRTEKRQRDLIKAPTTPAPPPSDDYPLADAVAALPEPYREVVLLRYYSDQTCTQVADQLGLPLGTVTKRLSRAYAMLRESLRPQSRQPEGQP